MRFCNECNVEIVCDSFSNQINENKDFEANLKLLKRQRPNEQCFMLPYFEENDLLRERIVFTRIL